jgi:hypothetical protein
MLAQYQKLLIVFNQGTSGRCVNFLNFAYASDILGAFHAGIVPLSETETTTC